MAKFLPFVVEKSTPIHIFQTLVSRSKGMNQILVASILYLVLEKGIGNIREIATKLPEMELSKLYEQIINTYPSYRITNEQFSKIQLLEDHIQLWHTEEISAELKEYEMSDVLSFLLVMVLVDKGKDYTSLDFSSLFNGQSDDAETSLIELNLFSNSGEDYYFNSKEDLAAYIWCHSVIAPRKDNVLPIRAVYYPGKPNAIPQGQRGSSKKPKTRFDSDIPGKSYDSPESTRNNPFGNPPMPPPVPKSDGSPPSSDWIPKEDKL